MKIRTNCTGVMSTILLAGLCLGRADSIVVPNQLAATEGNLGNAAPFFPVTTPGMRYQQVYHASQFAAISSPSLITQIAFRPDGISGRAFTEFLPNVEIYLSTTAAKLDALNLAFADNRGADNTLVRSGSLSLSSSFTGPADGPKDFDIVVTFTTPFLYNPAAGNLLLEVKNYRGDIGLQFFDADDNPGNNMSRAYTFGTGETVNSSDSFGLVTQFTFVPVPEPSTGVLLLAAAGLEAARRLRARR